MTLQTAKPFEVICLLDPAIDTSEMTAAELRAYERDRDVSTLKFKQGASPMRLTVRPLTKGQQLEIESSSPNDSVKFVRAFRFAMIKAMDVTNEHGKLSTFEPADTKHGLSGDELDAGPFDLPLILDVGSVVWARSFLVRGSTPRCAVHPSLLAQWEALPCLSAEQSAARQSKSKDSATQAYTDSGATSNDALSVSPTAAPVTEPNPSQAA